MRTLPTFFVVATLTLAMAGCGIVYKPNIQQGNVLEQAKVDQLKPGMSKKQVLVLLGQPSIASPFAQDRWDYVTTQQKRGGKINKKDLTLYFANGSLLRTEGEIFNATPLQQLTAAAQYPMILHNKKKEAEAKRKGQGG